MTTVGMPVLMIDMTAIPQNRRATKKLAGDTGHGVEEDRELTDRLILEARNGCVDSFRQLVSLHHRKVRLFLARYIRCPSHVDDLAQEVFLAAHLQLEHFRAESSFSTWLLGVAKNKAMTFVRNELRRHAQREQYCEAEIAAQSLSRLYESNVSAERNQRRVAALQSCLQQLDDGPRLLIEQFYFSQQSSAEIAVGSNKNPSAIRMSLLRIRKKLVACIKTKIESED